MKLSQRTVATATQEVTIEPALKTKLTTRLKKLQGLKAARDAAKKAYEKEAKNVEGYFEQAGVNSLTIEGLATVTEVRGVSSALDKKLFVQLGGSLAMLEEATVTTPKKPYVLVTFAKGDE